MSGPRFLATVVVRPDDPEGQRLVVAGRGVCRRSIDSPAGCGPVPGIEEDRR